MSHFGDFEHHFQVSVGDCIPNIWVMSKWDIYQPLFLDSVYTLTFLLHHGGTTHAQNPSVMSLPKSRLPLPLIPTSDSGGCCCQFWFMILALDVIPLSTWECPRFQTFSVQLLQPLALGRKFPPQAYGVA